MQTQAQRQRQWAAVSGSRWQRYAFAPTLELARRRENTLAKWEEGGSGTGARNHTAKQGQETIRRDKPLGATELRDCSNRTIFAIILTNWFCFLKIPR